MDMDMVLTYTVSLARLRCSDVEARSGGGGLSAGASAGAWLADGAAAECLLSGFLQLCLRDGEGGEGGAAGAASVGTGGMRGLLRALLGILRLGLPVLTAARAMAVVLLLRSLLASQPCLQQARHARTLLAVHLRCTCGALAVHLRWTCGALAAHLLWLHPP